MNKSKDKKKINKSTKKLNIKDKQKLNKSTEKLNIKDKQKSNNNTNEKSDEKGKNIPWIEKYRPRDMSNTVLDERNRDILMSFIKNTELRCPNLLFYGQPGTGKTTTIFNFISSYRKERNVSEQSLILHMNASDERGIQIIRDKIKTFVSSQGLFIKGTKFVILDEVDYMTSNAQVALYNIIQNYSNNDIVFCLLCNYVSKLHYNIVSSMVKIDFYNFSYEFVSRYLSDIWMRETSKVLSKNVLSEIVKYNYPDIRSMVNDLQLYYNNERKPKNMLLAIHNKVETEILIYFMLFLSRNKVTTSTTTSGIEKMSREIDKLFGFINRTKEEVNTTFIITELLGLLLDYCLYNDLADDEIYEFYVSHMNKKYKYKESDIYYFVIRYINLFLSFLSNS